MTGRNHDPPRPHVVKVQSGTTFRVGDTRNMGSLHPGGGVCQEVRRPISLSFTPLPEALDQADIVPADCMKEKEALVLHVAFLALHEYEARHGHPPRPWHARDADKFLELFCEINEQRVRKAEEDARLVRTFAHTAGGQTAPLISVVGGVAAQEVAKACSAKFPPLRQWLYLDALECLPQDTSELLASGGEANPTDRYSAQAALFGRRFQERLGDLRYFIVGAGAIGCELLKNLALAGVGAGVKGEGGLTITDMDVIEKSNLSRQFLFRSGDVTRPKSETAAAAAKAINPGLRVIAHQLRVGPETEHVFGASFYESMDGVALALDNVEARRYMDHACWLHRRPMLESGTLGPSGSVQPVLPGVTERYQQEQVPGDRPVAVCTLKRFPTTIEHTLQWARDTFEGEFTAVPEAGMSYLKGGGGPPDSDMKITLRQALVEEVPHGFKDCVAWARRHWQLLFHDTILDLLEEFPPDKLTSTGTPFWSDGKQRPRPLHFHPEDPLHLAFIHAAANLQAAVYGLHQVSDQNVTLELVAGTEVPPRNFRYSGREGTIQEKEGIEVQAMNTLPSPASLPHLHLSSLIFEKDDDHNFHIDFITAASNLRASNYSIAPVDRATSKRIAGRIIPAIVTSTGVAAGLAVLELLKLAQGHRHLDAYKISEFNLALCRFCIAQPAPADDLDDRWHVEGDRLEVEGEMTMEQLLDLFRDVHLLEVILVAVGNLTLYSFLLPKAERLKRSAMTISAIVEEVGGEGWAEAGPRVLMLELGAEDQQGQEVEVPPVRYFIRKEEE
ncbi:Ubiquitin-like modifier-activating enzyme 1 [Chionoecetes opilio]|uniref:Ubiquitin-like modifier-activating enzyme 1 n=1 Tax=Chionoecetes opilio TaxID=41210 RepID=A0A8J5D2B5_CHIOP|nr:Ubiquitin-like modifier-activating enzyme 1 [Chionoecetes opilio]